MTARQARPANSALFDAFEARRRRRFLSIFGPKTSKLCQNPSQNAPNVPFILECGCCSTMEEKFWLGDGILTGFDRVITREIYRELTVGQREHVNVK